jgi:hypothetical protein
MVARRSGKWQFPLCGSGEIVNVAAFMAEAFEAALETGMMNLRFAAVVPWFREAAVLALVLACIAVSGSTPIVTAAKPTVDRLAQALPADVTMNDTNADVAKVRAAKLDSSRVNVADVANPPAAIVASQQPAAASGKITLASADTATLEIAHPDTTAAVPVTTPAPVAVATAAPDQIVTAALTPATETLPGETASEQPASQSITTAQPGDSGIEVVDDCIVIESCVDRYLWKLYQQAPKEDAVRVEERRQVTVKRKGKQVTVTRTVSHVADEDFGWKDPKAADRVNMPVADYVIGGMDRDFKLRLFQMLHAAEQAGLAPGISSAFRDDYRQSIASGLKAADNRSYHGGSLRGGYGHGLAADIVSVKGATRADRLASTNILWNWVDANGKNFGIGRPYMGRDPPHVAPIDGEEYAKHHPSRAARQASAAKPRNKLAMAAR